MSPFQTHYIFYAAFSHMFLNELQNPLPDVYISWANFSYCVMGNLAKTSLSQKIILLLTLQKPGDKLQKPGLIFEGSATTSRT